MVGSNLPFNPILKSISSNLWKTLKTDPIPSDEWKTIKPDPCAVPNPISLFGLPFWNNEKLGLTITNFQVSELKVSVLFQMLF